MGLHRKKKRNTRKPTSTSISIATSAHAHANNTTQHPFVSSLCFAVSTFSLAESLKVITDAVHFISMRTKTAWGTHYHFTEKDWELSACLFTLLRSDIFQQRRHCRLTRTVFSAEGKQQSREGQEEENTDTKGDRDRGVILSYRLCKPSARLSHGVHEQWIFRCALPKYVLVCCHFHFLYSWDFFVISSTMWQKQAWLTVLTW